MLDHRIQTFLMLCDTKNYTKTAAQLHVTQPAVTQHIQYLEESYGVKLFEYQRRRLFLTEAGERLRAFALSVRADEDRIRQQLILAGDAPIPLKFGATLTIGEYTMPGIIKQALDEMPKLKLTMYVKNTQALLWELERGLVDFALVEGNFDRSLYQTRLFSQEEFIAVCSSGHRLADGEERTLEELLEERLLVREAGSGTRGILEQALYDRNLTLPGFSHVVQLGSMATIKRLVAAGCGVAFLYREAVRNELAQGSISQVKVQDFSVKREFDFVSLKNSIHAEEHEAWFRRFIQWR